MVGQAQTGKGKSIPKVVAVKADDALKVIYKQIGNNHAYPFMWADTVTVVSGTSEAVIASGVEFHGYDLATYGNVVASPMGVAASWYLDKDTVTNIVKIVTASPVGSDTDFDIQIVLGTASASRYIEDLVCRGNTGVTKNY